MEKVFIEVVVPATGKKYEFIIPEVMKVGVAAELIAQAVQEAEGIKPYKDNAILCKCEDETVLPSNSTISNTGITDGTKLILV
ncbi:hypothetical protein [Acetivibrio cellulolyticus]|uniref:hypothetical protein n=1 Tax=Acetivibrio cellulolyticus TaxID=35830 RepID=UPI0001E2D99B|nr:hypothetical protein [Acetivibrio cellulolyticus]